MNDWGDDFDEAKLFSKPAGAPFSEEFYLRMDADNKRLLKALVRCGERLNAKVPEVEERVFFASNALSPFTDQVVMADLARDLGRRALHYEKLAQYIEGLQTEQHGQLIAMQDRAESAERQLAEAVEKERERCAKVADAFSVGPMGRVQWMTATQIAAAIRGSSEGGGT